MTPIENARATFAAMCGSIYSFNMRRSVHLFSTRSSVYSVSTRCSAHLFSIHTIAIVCVDHKDEALRFLVVLAPQRKDLVLYTDGLHREANVIVLHFHGVISYHQVRATYSVRLLSSIRYTKRTVGTGFGQGVDFPSVRSRQTLIYSDNKRCLRT
uniref:Uncharacterized protein n=1 Tax=Hyaloperonospora arabidopsidis (strain Emoy2) TaxID=559515 RepID=M4C032_HYAAE